MIRKIKNPYTAIEGYNCFACAPHNEFGLKMEFYEEDEFVCSRWVPDQKYQGYKNILHGGIQATLMDELAAWYIQVKLKTSGVTVAMTTRFLKPVFLDKGELYLRSCLKDRKGREVHLYVELFNSEGILCSEADVTYLAYPENYARRQLAYPGAEKFFE